MERFLGRDLAVCEFGFHDWDRYARQRQGGAIDSRGDRLPPEERAEDKIRREWLAPVINDVRDTLERLYQERLAEHGVPGDESWIFPAPEAEGEHLRVDVSRLWLCEAERLAGVDHPKGFGWHALRRAWASQREDLPAQDVATAGGWADTQTLQLCYQHADPEATERVVRHEGDSLPGVEAAEGDGELHPGNQFAGRRPKPWSSSASSTASGPASTGSAWTWAADIAAGGMMSHR